MEKNKNVLIITCSNRANHSSYYMAMKLLRKIQRQQKEVEILQLADSNLRGCCGTAACANEETVRCVHAKEDDFYEVFDKMTKSSCVLFIIPKYAPYPSKLMQLYERIVSMCWWGYVEKNRVSEFALYQKPVGLICFASTAETTKDTFLPLQKSFDQIRLKLLSLGQDGPMLFINKAKDNEDVLLERVIEAVGKI